MRRSITAATLPHSAGAGFSLLEVMVVLAIIGLLVGAVGKMAFQAFRGAKVKTARTQVRAVQDVVVRQLLDDGSCPDGLAALVTAGHLRAEQVRDPWHTPLALRCPPQREADGADVVSAGPDQRAGTADDISSSDPVK